MYSSKLNKLSSNNIRQISVKAFVKKNRENTSTVAVYSDKTYECQCYNPCGGQVTARTANGEITLLDFCVNGNTCTSVMYIDTDLSCGVWCRDLGISDCSCGDCNNGNVCEDTDPLQEPCQVCLDGTPNSCNCTGNEC